MFIFSFGCIQEYVVTCIYIIPALRDPTFNYRFADMWPLDYLPSWNSFANFRRICIDYFYGMIRFFGSNSVITHCRGSQQSHSEIGQCKSAEGRIFR